MSLFFGKPYALTLTAAAGASFAVVPLYTYNAAKRAQEAWDSQVSPEEAVDPSLDPTPRPANDKRLLCAVPQGDFGVQLCEVALDDFDRPRVGVLEPLADDIVADDFGTETSRALSHLKLIARVIRGDLDAVLVEYVKEDGSGAGGLRRLKPTLVFQAARKGVSRHLWPITVICDDIDKQQPGKSFLLSRMDVVDTDEIPF